jgi:hypothetical protein
MIADISKKVGIEAGVRERLKMSENTKQPVRLHML